MANRFPLIIDSSINRIVELPTTDNLDLAGSSISSVTEITTTSNVNVGGEVIVSNDNAHGGVDYAGIMTMTNSSVGVATPNKFLRIDDGGSLQFVNSADTSVILQLTDEGELTVPMVQLQGYYETVHDMGTVSGTISPDISDGTIQTLELSGNITMDSITNILAGSSMTLILAQDSSGNHTLTSSWKFAGGSKTLSTAANAIDIISVFYDGSFYYATLSKGYA